MEVLAIGSTIILMILGYFLMDRIDNLLVRNRGTTYEMPVDRRSVLIFSDKESEHEFRKMFDELKCSYFFTDNTMIPENLEFGIFFAMSSDDADNIFISKQIRKKRKDTWIIARVNDYIFADLYVKAGVDRIIKGKLAVDKIAESLGEVSANV